MARVTKSDLDWFLGRYDVTDRRNNKHPFREFTGINRKANEIKLEMDFLEVDSWDSDARYGPDCIYVHIDGVRSFLGIYANWRGKGHRSGIHGGIRWTSSSHGAQAPSIQFTMEGPETLLSFLVTTSRMERSTSSSRPFSTR